MSFDKEQLRTCIIEPTLNAIGLYSQSAVNLLLGTCAQESKFGTYLKQINGPALGIYQIEPNTHKDIWDNFLKFKSELADKVLKLGQMHDASLIVNLAYATAIARIKYLRAPEALPAANDLAGLARYWKRYYNTFLGSGTVQEFINNYNRYVANV